MRTRALAVLAAPAPSLATAVPAQASWVPVAPKDGGRVQAQAVSFKNHPGSSPMKQVRSSLLSCRGTVISKVVVKDGSKPAGELTVYAQPARNTTAVACFKHVGTTKGKRLPTSVALVSAKSPTAKPAVEVVASGNFVSYAGPVGISNVKGACVQAAGVIKVGKKAVLAQSPVLCDR